MSENIDMSFPDVITKLCRIWENSEKDNELLQVELQEYKDNIEQLRKGHTELLNKFETINEQNRNLVNEITHLKKQIQDSEDDQKQFRKVSHILTMDRENNNYKQQMAILEKRVAFYQNQCNKLKANVTETLDKQTLTENIMVNIETNTQDTSTDIVDGTSNDDIEDNKDTVNDSNIISIEASNDDIRDIVNDSMISVKASIDDIRDNKDIVNDNNISIEASDEDDIEVKEKKIKGVVYYVSNDDDIYMKNEDDSIGELKGKIELLASGKTKVKWYK